MILAKDTTVPATPNAKKGVVIPPITMSRTLKKLLNDPKFIASFPISTSTTVPTPLPTSTSPAYENNPLSLILLEYSPDFIHVVSLKGAFLYVAPSVRRVLGWEPEDLVGKSVADLAHPEDVVPLMRELKEGSAGVAIGDRIPGDTIFSGAETTKGSGIGVGGAVVPAGTRTVDMLFRARTKSGKYVWVESRGRLHAEPGKGRKAIVLSGRAKEMGRLPWGAIAKYGMTKPVYAPMENLPADNIGKVVKMVRREFWAMAGGSGSVSFLFVGSGVTDVLGWGAEELIGKRVTALVVDVDGNVDGEAARLLQRGGGVGEVKEVRCTMAKKDGGVAQVAVVVFSTSNGNQDTGKLRVSPAPFVVQIKLVDASNASTLPASLSSESTSAGTTSTSALVHPLDANIFEELETSRGTSWQYELEKLRFANVRLEQEIERLEAVVAQGAGGDVEGDSAVCAAESDKAEGPTTGDTQYHLCSPMDGSLDSSTEEFETIIQQLPQEDLYDPQYQSRPQYQEQHAPHSQQETAPCHYMYSIPQRQHSQSHPRLSQVPHQQQSMYATAPLQAPVPQTMTLPPLLQYEDHDGYNNNHHSYDEAREDLDQERRQKRMRYMGPRPEAQLPSRMPVAPVMGYPRPSHVPLSQVVVPSSRPSVSMQEWVQQQQQRYVPQLRGLKRAWTGHES
jgi:PAS domain-containing protein